MEPLRSATLLSLERFVPPHRHEQAEVTEWVRRWLAEAGDHQSSRLLSVYAAAGVARRGSVLPLEQTFHPGDLETQTRRYREAASAAACDLARRALARAEVAPADVSMIVSVSCTGVMIPAVDAYVANALQMGPRLVRLPITESGCAGGVVGLARAVDHLLAHPDAAALVLSVELSSLTFQRWDRSATNVVSTAIFGDGGAAAVLAGPRHPRAGKGLLRIGEAESQFFAETTHLMGFNLGNRGLQIVLDRTLAPFLRRKVAVVVDGYLQRRGLSRADIARWILHPGGRRIIEVMQEQLGLAEGDLEPTEAVLSEHGNMSSATVLFVLDEILRRHPPAGSRGLLGAFGPGFGAEFALVEFT